MNGQVGGVNFPGMIRLVSEDSPTRPCCDVEIGSDVTRTSPREQAKKSPANSLKQMRPHPNM